MSALSALGSRPVSSATDIPFLSYDDLECWSWFPGKQLIGGNADDAKPERNALSSCRRADRACVYRMRSGESGVRAGTGAATRGRCQWKAGSDRRPACPLSGAGGERADGSEGAAAVARDFAGAHQGDG